MFYIGLSVLPCENFYLSEHVFVCLSVCLFCLSLPAFIRTRASESPASIRVGHLFETRRSIEVLRYIAIHSRRDRHMDRYLMHYSIYASM